MPDLGAAMAMRRTAAPGWWENLWKRKQDPPSAGEVQEREEPPGYAVPSPGLPPDLVGPHGTVTHGWGDLTSTVRGYRTRGGAYPITRGKGRRRRPESSGPGLWPMIPETEAPWLPDGTEVRVLGQGKARAPERREPADLSRREDLIDVTIVELIDPDLDEALIGTRWGMRPEDLFESQPFDIRRKPAHRTAAGALVDQAIDQLAGHDMALRMQLEDAARTLYEDGLDDVDIAAQIMDRRHRQRLERAPEFPGTVLDGETATHWIFQLTEQEGAVALDRKKMWCITRDPEVWNQYQSRGAQFWVHVSKETGQAEWVVAQLEQDGRLAIEVYSADDVLQIEDLPGVQDWHADQRGVRDLGTEFHSVLKAVAAGDREAAAQLLQGGWQSAFATAKMLAHDLVSRAFIDQVIKTVLQLPKDLDSPYGEGYWPKQWADDVEYYLDWRWAEPPLFAEARQANDQIVESAKWNGIKVDVEWEAGTVREYPDSDYKRYMAWSYGYIRHTEGEDGEELDCFVDFDRQDVESVYVVVQKAGQYEDDEGEAELGSFDEFDIILGAEDEAEAEAVMRLHYDKEQVGAVFAIPIEDFKKLVLPIIGEKTAAPRWPYREPLQSDEGYGIIDQHGGGDTWTAGSCYPLARALVERLGGELWGVYSSDDYGAAGQVPQHVVVRKGDLFFDADGPQTRDRLLRRWTTELYGAQRDAYENAREWQDMTGDYSEEIEEIDVEVWLAPLDIDAFCDAEGFVGSDKMVADIQALFDKYVGERTAAGWVGNVPEPAGPLWHITTDPGFAITPGHKPEDAWVSPTNTSGQMKSPGLFVTDNPQYWRPWFENSPGDVFFARIDVSGLSWPEEYHAGREYTEYLIAAPEKARVVELLSVAEAAARNIVGHEFGFFDAGSGFQPRPAVHDDPEFGAFFKEYLDDGGNRTAALVGVEGREEGIPIGSVRPGDRVRLLSAEGGLRADALCSVVAVDPAGPSLLVRSRGMDQDPSDGSWGTGHIEVLTSAENVQLVLAPGDDRIG